MNSGTSTTDLEPGDPGPAKLASPSGNATAIALTGLVKRFGDVTAVAGLDLTVRPGEIVAFLGPNGAGKTTTIDMLLGLSRPSSGTVEVFGMDPSEAVAHGRVAAVMQTGGCSRT